MSVPLLVANFYEVLWNRGDRRGMAELLSPQFVFRGSLGDELVGHDAFWGYVCRVRSALDDYRCEILECVSEGDNAFAKMRFIGKHVGPMLGYSATGRVVSWNGAALFTFEGDLIVSLWVLGDLDALRRQLQEQPA